MGEDEQPEIGWLSCPLFQPSLDIRASSPTSGAASFFSLFHSSSLLLNLARLPTTAQQRPLPPHSPRPRWPHSKQFSTLPSPPTQGSPRQLRTQLQPVARPHLDLLHPPCQAADPGAEILLLQAPRVSQDFSHERSHRHETYPQRPGHSSCQRRNSRPARGLTAWPAGKLSPVGARAHAQAGGTLQFPAGLAPPGLATGRSKTAQAWSVPYWFSNVSLPADFLLLFCVFCTRSCGMFHLVNSLWSSLYSITSSCEII